MVESRVEYPRQEESARNPVIDQHSEVVKGLESFVESKLHLLLPVDKIWQPSELLPDFSNDEDLKEARKQAANVSPALLVVLIGNTITEEALPNYTNWYGRFPAVADITGTDINPWALWQRGWTAEEHRHEVVLDAYLRYSGRVNMLAVERTTQHLLRAGFNPQIGKDPYKPLIFTSHQEPAAQTSHKNVAKLAHEQGDDYLFRICGKPSGDEGRHAAFFQPVTGEIFKQDPNGAVIAMRDMYKPGISMPGALMTEDGVMPKGRQSDLFEQFAKASIDTGVYTPHDYVNIFEHLMKIWNVEKLSVSGEGAKAQDDLGRILRVHKRMLERSSSRQSSTPANIIYPWIKS